MTQTLQGAQTPSRRAVGQWIWIEGEAKPYNFYLYARGTVTVDGAPAAARLHVTASDRYMLYVNGAYVGRGPARSDPRFKTYDTYDVAAALRPGRNVIAVRAYHYGSPAQGSGWGSTSGNGYTAGERAGLWAQVELTDAGGATQVSGTGPDWRLLPSPAWNTNTPMVNSGLVGSNEIYDASADVPNWTGVDFDDGEWTRPWLVPPPDQPWHVLEARDIPLLRETELPPARVSLIGELIDMGNARQKDIYQVILEGLHFPLEHAAATNVEAVLNDGSQSARFQGVFVPGKGIRTPYVVLDFGRQVFGFPRVRLEAEAGAILDLTYGQQLINDRLPGALSYADRYITRDGVQTWEAAEYKQFRYLFIAIRSTYSPVHIRSISLNEYTYPAPLRGSFECADPVLTALWKASVDTTDLHLEDTIVCDAYRERLPWNSGDGSHGLHGALMAYGDIDLNDRFLRQFITTDRGDGMLQMVFPRENPTNHSIAQFLLQWSTRIREHYEYTGRRALLEQAYPSVVRQNDWYEPYRGELGLLRDMPEQIWMDWTPVDLRGANFSTNALYVNSLEDGAWIAAQLGQEDDRARWQRIADEVRAQLREHFWNPDLGVYEDSHHRGRLTGVAGELAQGFALLYGIATDEQAARICESLAGRSTELFQASPLWYPYVLEGMLARGLEAEALRLIHNRYARMMSAHDNPTLWEGWDPFTAGTSIHTDEDFERRHTTYKVRPAGVRSLVHSGGVYAGWVLSTRVLGVRAAAPGMSRLRVHPRTGNLAWARGTFPAPGGDVRVEWRRSAGGTQVSLDLPEGHTADIVLDRASDAHQVFTHNGERLDTPAAGATVEVPVGPGRHTVELSRG